MLDGKLLGAPNLAQDERLDRDAYGLVPIALREWEGLVGLNLADEPASFLEQVERLLVARFGSLETFARYGVGGLAVGRSITYERSPTRSRPTGS